MGLMMHYSLLKNKPEPDKQTVEEVYDGIICRCTGTDKTRSTVTIITCSSVFLIIVIHAYNFSRSTVKGFCMNFKQTTVHVNGFLFIVSSFFVKWHLLNLKHLPCIFFLSSSMSLMLYTDS